MTMPATRGAIRAALFALTAARAAGRGLVLVVVVVRDRAPIILRWPHPI